MNANLNVSLYPHEIEFLLAALRRDVASETAKAASDAGRSLWHSANARYGIRLLEALNPKGRVLKGTSGSPDYCNDGLQGRGIERLEEALALQTA